MKKQLLSLMLMLLVATLTYGTDLSTTIGSNAFEQVSTTLETSILSYSIPGQDTSIIDTTDFIITVTLPKEYNEPDSLVALIPEFTLSTGATAWIGNEQVTSTISTVDFSQLDVTYDIKNGDSVQAWTVKLDIIPEDTTTSIKFKETLQVKLFPNPVVNEVNFISNENINSIRVLNVVGQTVETIQTSGTSVNLNISNYQKGVYLFVINNDQVLKVYKQ